MKVVPLRLQPGDDLRRSLEAWTGAQQELAGGVISAVGSLSLAQLRHSRIANISCLSRLSALSDLLGGPWGEASVGGF